MKRLLAAVAIAALAIAGPAAMTATAEGQPTRATKAAAAAYTPPPLHWGKCTDPDLEDNPFDILCADLVVPLDYNKPGGQKISLRVSRLEHSSPDSQYQGVMITNPGGPGASGLYLAVYGIGDFVPGNSPVFAQRANDGAIRLAAVGFVIKAYNQNFHAAIERGLALCSQENFARRALGFG